MIFLSISYFSGYDSSLVYSIFIVFIKFEDGSLPSELSDRFLEMYFYMKGSEDFNVVGVVVFK